MVCGSVDFNCCGIGKLSEPPDLGPVGGSVGGGAVGSGVAVGGALVAGGLVGSGVGGVAVGVGSAPPQAPTMRATATQSAAMA